VDNRINDLRRLVQAIETVAETVADELQGGSLTQDDQVAIGHLLVALGKKADEALDPLKRSLREIALQQQSKPGTVYLDSAHGPTCLVVIPKPSVQVHKDTDMEVLKGILGTRFDVFFETMTNYKPRPEFENRTAACNDERERQAVIDAVKVDEGTPRVSFKE